MPLLQLDDALAHLIDDGRIVGGHNDRRPGAIDAIQQLHDALGRGRVEVARGLIRDEHRRLVDKGSRDCDPLLFAAGELIGHALLFALKSDQLEDLRDNSLHLGAGLANDFKGKRDVIEDRLVG